MKYDYRNTKRSDIKSYEKDGKTFYAAFFRVKGYNGKVKQIHKHGLPSLKEAVQYIVDLKAKHEGKATVPLKVVARDYLESIQNSDFSPGTLRCKQSHIKRIVDFFGDVPICDITPFMIRGWMQSLAKTIRPQTVNSFKVDLSTIMQHAMTYFELKVNSAKLTQNLRVKEDDRREKNLWTDDDLRKALVCSTNKSVRVLLQLLYYSGLRIGEALALKPSDIVDTGILVLRQRTARNTIRHPKNNSIGKVLLHPDFIRILTEYIREAGIPEDGFIFPFSYWFAWNNLRILCRIANVPAITPHSLRHSSLTNDANRGTPLLALQAKARHRSSSITEQYYLHLSEKTQAMLNFDYTIVDL